MHYQTRVTRPKEKAAGSLNMQATQRLDAVGTVWSLLFLALFRLQAAVSASSKFLLKFVDSTSGVNKLQLAGVKRMARAADIDFQLGTQATRLERRATTATYGHFYVLGVDIGFHDWCEEIEKKSE